MQERELCRPAKADTTNFTTKKTAALQSPPFIFKDLLHPHYILLSILSYRAEMAHELGPASKSPISIASHGTIPLFISIIFL